MFTVEASPAPANAVTVKVAITQTGSVIAAGAVKTYNVVITGGQTSKTLTIATDDDGNDEPDGSVIATVNTHSSYTVGSTKTATIVVTDNDDPKPVVSVAAVSSSVTEGANAIFTVTASPAPASNLVVFLNVGQVGSFASSGLGSERRVTITQNTATNRFNVPTTNDTTDEANGAITAAINTNSAYSVGNPSSARVTVIDDDNPPPTPTTTTTAPSYTPSYTPTYTPSYTPVYEPLEPYYYDPTQNPYNPTPSEPDETTTTNNDGGSGADDGSGTIEASEAGDPPAAQEVVAAPTGPPKVSVAGGGAVIEGQNAVFTITVDRALTTAVDVNVSIARKGNFVAASERGSRNVTIPAGQNRVSFAVPTLDGNADEPDGVVYATLNDGPRYDIAGARTAEVQVKDNDPGPHDGGSASAQSQPSATSTAAASEPSPDQNLPEPVEAVTASVDTAGSDQTEPSDQPEPQSTPDPLGTPDSQAAANDDAAGDQDNQQTAAEALTAPTPDILNPEPTNSDSGAVALVAAAMLAIIAFVIGSMLYNARRRQQRPSL